MRYIIHSFFMLLLLNCHTHKSVTKKNSSNLQQETHYFAVNFNFSKDKITPISFDKQDGLLGYEIFLPTDLFLVAYENNELIYYAELTNPLQMRVVGETEEVLTTAHAEEYINLPQLFSNKKNSKNRKIIIYKTTDYIENFKSKILLYDTLINLKKQKSIKLVYTIDATSLSEFLSSKN